jgi:hypothetical protein
MWAVPIARTGAMGNSCLSTVGIPPGKKLRQTPMYRWEDNIKMDTVLKKEGLWMCAGFIWLESEQLVNSSEHSSIKGSEFSDQLSDY